MGDELSIVLLARLYYEMGSPMRASALLRRNGYDEEALLFESLCQEGKLIISNALERGDAKKVEDGFLFESGISLEGRAILPLNRRMRGKLLEDFDGLLEQTFLNYLKDMEL
ncbi:MAG: hypothetical protein D6769_03785 [Methanobacteriota archaeon]|nr:MAG: hypothetical protein D6769_03785 [Euryarchaeota archaeon]